MEIKTFGIQTPDYWPVIPGWSSNWYGYEERSDVYSDLDRQELTRSNIKDRASGVIPEEDYQIDCLLSILTSLKRDTVNFMDLGSGYGRWSLVTSGVIDHQRIPGLPKSCYCLAVEADPVHYIWTKEHFEHNRLLGKVIEGAVSNKEGTKPFLTGLPPDKCYGQQLLKSYNPWKYLNPPKLYQDVSVYTVDSLWASKDKLDLVFMDVQGEELNVLKGMKTLLKNRQISYFLIGVHSSDLQIKIQDYLKDCFKIVVSIPPRTKRPVKTWDGILVMEARE